MYVQSKALVLHTLKYNDNSLIAHCYTSAAGRQSFLLKGILSSRKGRLSKALFQPLMLLEIEFLLKNKTGLSYIKEAKVSSPYTSCFIDIKKNALVLFLSEVLHKCLKEETANPLLFDFLEGALLWLDSHDQIANFHLTFLLHLTKFLGFYPYEETPNADYFNFENGCFTNTPPLEHHIEGPSVGALQKLLGMKFAIDKPQKMNHQTRRELLLALINYYTFHIDGFNPPKSLDVLQTVFDE